MSELATLSVLVKLLDNPVRNPTRLPNLLAAYFGRIGAPGFARLARALGLTMRLCFSNPFDGGF